VLKLLWRKLTKFNRIISEEKLVIVSIVSLTYYWIGTRAFMYSIVYCFANCNFFAFRYYIALSIQFIFV